MNLLLFYLRSPKASDIESLVPGTTPKTVSDKEWMRATDKMMQSWPRTAGPPVVMNPISRQNFIVKFSDA
ncbi:hypothetical protein AXF42_Ash001729 [Apostasia shenzhenica]|uniref:Uncharacterized protein n=1 Tax=Apostasia shenzhenica TaxID=1088818 RepID=A0A2I0AB20_9ASPA|nr:hypothetical protein AXF42_Ash001729 [Apostasia shenzhenica]